MNKLLLYFLRIFYTKYSCLKNIYNYEKINKEILNECPLCKDKRVNDFCKIDRYGFKVSSMYCENCGLIFINPRIDLDAYNQFYMDGSYRKIIAALKQGKKGDHHAVPKRLVSVLEYIKESFVDTPVDILDIGGTSGVFEYLNDNLTLNKYLCINPGADEADLDVSNKIKVKNTTIEEYESNEDKYDLILLFGTISHLMYPYEAFAKITSLLKENGVVIIDFKDSVKRMKSSTFPFLQIHFDHPIYLSEDSFSNLIKLTGLDIEKKFEHGTISYYFLKRQRNTEKDKKMTFDGSELKKLSLLCNNLAILRIVINRLQRRIRNQR